MADDVFCAHYLTGFDVCEKNNQPCPFVNLPPPLRRSKALQKCPHLNSELDSLMAAERSTNEELHEREKQEAAAEVHRQQIAASQAKLRALKFAPDDKPDDKPAHQ